MAFITSFNVPSPPTTIKFLCPAFICSETTCSACPLILVTAKSKSKLLLFITSKMLNHSSSASELPAYGFTRKNIYLRKYSKYLFLIINSKFFNLKVSVISVFTKFLI